MKDIFTLLFVFCSQLSISQSIHHWETAVYANDSWRYFVGNSEPNPFWRALSYNDENWLVGKGGFGYGDGDDSTLIAPCYALYLRTSFSVSDTSVLSSAVFNIDFDDGFIAYINGIEIARSGMEGSYPAYNTPAVDHEAKVYAGGTYDYFSISKNVLSKCLVNGKNILSIQIHNSNIGSSDLTALPFLSFGIIENKQYFKTTPPWFVVPNIIESFTSNLPIVQILTNGMVIADNGIKQNARMRVINSAGRVNAITDSATNYSGNVGIEIRGSTSSGYPQKGYNVETRQPNDESRNVSLLGMPEENDWALIANYNDKTLVRNTFSYHLFSKMGHYAPRTRYCELFINADYQGIYMLTEKIKRDKNRVDITKYDDAAISGDKVSGGFIFKNDNKDADEVSFFSNYSEKGVAGLNEVPFIYVYPKSNELTAAHKKYLPDFIQAFENVLYGPDFIHPTNGYKRYIDFNSFVDYFILGEVSRSVDAYKKSKFFFKDLDSKGGLIHSGPPWDFDWAYKNIPEGNNQFECYYGNTDGSGWAYKAYLCNHSPKFPGWVARLMQDPAFVNAVKTRYLNLRKSFLSKTNVNQLIDSLSGILHEAQVRHFAKWDILGKNTLGAPEVDAQPITFSGAINQIKNWLDIRLQWLDRNLPGTVTKISQDVKTEFTIYPNPTRADIHIESSHRIKNVEIYSSVGSILYSNKFADTKISISSNDFSKGMLFCKLYFENGLTHTKKLLIL